MTETLTKKDVEIFLTDWEWYFLRGYEYYLQEGKRLSKLQKEKFREIDQKLQDVLDDVNLKAGASSKVVNLTKKPRTINLSNFVHLSETDPRFTTLTEAQQQAIKNIKKYWINRAKNYENWKSQSHWSFKKTSLSSRINESLFTQLKSLNVNRIIQRFVRAFLRSPLFRENFLEKLEEQFANGNKFPIVGVDITAQFTQLINMYPRVVSAKVSIIEKELFTFYFTFISEFSVSYALRCALIHERDLLDQEPIQQDEVIPILSRLIKEESELNNG